MTFAYATTRRLQGIEAGKRIHGAPTLDRAICDESHRKAEAYIAGPVEIAMDHMVASLSFAEILGTHLGPTLRSELLRTAPICSELLRSPD